MFSLAKGRTRGMSTIIANLVDSEIDKTRNDFIFEGDTVTEEGSGLKGLRVGFAQELHRHLPNRFT